MTLLPLSPLLAVAFVGLAAILPPAATPAVVRGITPAAVITSTPASDRPGIHRVSDDNGGWRQYLVNGAGPVFRRPSGPLRG